MKALQSLKIVCLFCAAMLPAVVQAQFTYTINNGTTITITGYSGPGGAVTIPPTISVTVNYMATNLPVTSIGVQAFADLTSLTSVTIGTNVTSIGTNAFRYCTLLTSVTIPASVTSIEQAAFLHCTLLTSVTIPGSITNIGESAFGSCQSLTAITVNSQNPFYSSTNGVLFDKGQTTLLQYPGGLGGSYTIPATVTNIGANAFSGPSTLASVTIPSGVTSIGADAFNECYSLTSLTISNGVTSIGDGAFYHCEGLTNFAMPDSVTSIGDWAFVFCTNLTSITIPGSVTNIGLDAFDECYSLTSLTISNGVTSIGDWAFYDCTSLGSVTIPGSVTNIGLEAFYNCTNLTGVYFEGNAPTPTNDSSVFSPDNSAIVYYLPGTTGWGSTFDGCPAVLWNPQVQTGNASFGVRTNWFGFNITGTTNIPIVLEACTCLANPTWVPLQSCTLTNGSVYFCDPQWTNYPTRFYRLRSP
jgi:hypothetical protein